MNTRNIMEFSETKKRIKNGRHFSDWLAELLRAKKLDLSRL